MMTIIRLLVALCIATAVGLGLTAQALNGRPALGVVELGPWQVMTHSGQPSADPYSRAFMARWGIMPLASSDGIAFTAHSDESGQRLGGRCPVHVIGEAGPARVWTLGVYDEAWRPLANESGRHAFSSTEVERSGKDALDITISPDPRPGNWLPSGGAAHYHIVLRLYDTSAALTIGQKGAVNLPQIRRDPC